MVKPQDVINAKVKKAIVNHIQVRFDLSWDDDHVLLLDPSERLYGARREIFEQIERLGRVDTLGNYWGEWRHNEFRFSIEGAQRFGPKATKNIVEVAKEQAITFLRAQNISVVTTADNGFVIVKYENDYIGCGRLNNGEIVPFISKNRRLGSDVPE